MPSASRTSNHGFEPRPPSRKRLCRLSIGGAAIAGALLMAGCGSSEAVTILDTQKVEFAIEQSIMSQRNQVADVACPSGVHQDEAVEFSCIATVGSQDTRFAVTQTDDAGNVHYEAR